nr:alpha/beta hydrolase [uncultured Phenylobacterium sp.]
MWRSEPNYTAKQLGSIRSPVLVMAGQADSIPRAHTEAMARAIPGAREVIVAGATHFAPLTHPAQVNAPIVAFLGGRP